jgi:hypothetical protein
VCRPRNEHRTVDEVEQKHCSKCGEWKELGEFSKKKSRWDGLHGWCRACQANRYVLYPALYREQQIKRKYGLGPEEYNELLLKQGGACAICGRALETEKPNKVHVDHDHITGKVRGILCENCNKGIGFLKDSIESLQRAIAYLKGEL